MIVLAYKHQGVVYLATDTRVVFNHRKEKRTDEASRKIRILDNGIILGISSYDEELRKKIFDHPEIFTLAKGDKLTRRHIVTKIVPALFDMLKEGKSCQNDSENSVMYGDLILAYRDKLFFINSSLWTVECERWVDAGAYAYGVGFLAEMDETRDIEEQLVKAVKAAERYTTWIGGPFVTVNTRDLKVQVKEVEG